MKSSHIKCLNKTKKRKEKRKNEPNAKKNVKIAEKMFPITAETAKLQNSLTLSKKLPHKDNDDIEKRAGYA